MIWRERDNVFEGDYKVIVIINHRIYDLLIINKS